MLYELLQVLDSTYPGGPDFSWIWAGGIILGEFLALILTTLGVHYFSGKKVNWLDSTLIGVAATAISFWVGVLWWMAIGFW